MLNPSSSEIVSLFTRALACGSDAERSALLDQACAGHAELREQIEQLLQAHRQAGGFLEPKDINETVLAGPGYTSGTIIGQRYKLLELIAEGGMGTVWLAEQTHPVRRRVAIKLIKPGMDSRQILARFEAERQALAVMDHPHIAKVLDGGVTEQGRPYFVMEYVKGVPITQYCDQAKLNVEQRLKLMTQVCQAVQHAHQKGIIHRDLKPSNILVCLYDGQPVPKVIDFGLAKALHQPLTEGTVFTSHGLMVGTPLYMSPEQAEFNNLDIDTRSDVYSLGVILYELLTGSTPLDKQRFHDAAIQEIVRLIKEEEPSKPSTKLSGSGQLPSIAAQRSLEPAQLSRLMKGDLDWIVMKSLDKERSRRYETANGLAKDIERYLTDLPIEACPPSAMYKFRKFARRNRLALGAGAGIAAALILGTTVSTWLAIWALEAKDDANLARASESKLRITAEGDRDEAVRQTEIAERAQRNLESAIAAEHEARQEAEDQRDAARHQSQLALSTLTRIIEDMQESLRNLAGSGEVRRRLLATSLEQLEQVATEYVEQASVDRETMVALLAMGDVILQCGVGEDSEDSTPATTGTLPAEQRSAVELAQEFCMRAHDIAQDLAAADLASTQAQRDLAHSFEMLGNVSRQVGATEETMAFYQQSLDIRDTLASAEPTNIDAQRDLAHSCRRLGDMRLQLGQTQAALILYERMNEICLRMVAIDPTNADVQRDLSISYRKLGDVSRQLGHLSESLAYYQQFHEIAAALAAADPANAEAQRDLSLSYHRLGMVNLELGNTDVARGQTARLYEICELLAAADPTDTRAQRDLAVSCDRLGDVYRQLGDTGRAVEMFQKAMDISATLASADPLHAEAQRDLFAAHLNIGDMSREIGNIEDAIEYYQRALSIAETLATADPADARARRDLSVTYEKLGNSNLVFGNTEEALENYQLALDINTALASENPANAEAQRDLSVAYGRLGDVSVQLGAAEKADEYYRTSLGISESLVASDASNRVAQKDMWDFCGRLGHVCLLLGNTKDAVDLFRRQLQIAEGLVAAAPTNPQTQIALAGACENLGNVSLQLGKPLEALEYFQKQNEICLTQLAANPSSGQAERNLLLSYEKLGNVSVQFDVEQAVEYYLQQQQIAEKRFANNPGNSEAKRDLMISYLNLGDASMQLGQFEEADRYVQQQHLLCQSLAASDPANVTLQRDLAVSYDRLGTVNMQINNVVAAAAFYQQCLAINERLAATDPSNTLTQGDLALSHYKLGLADEVHLEFDAALAHYNTAIEMLTRLIDNGQNVETLIQQRGGIAALVVNLRNTADQARPLLVDWDTFISRPGGRARLSERIPLLARAGRFDEIPQSAEMLRSLDAENAVNLYNAACGYALCANAIQGEDGESLTSEQEAQRQEYIDLSLACLRESITAGWSDFEYMRQDSDLLVLRDLPEFQSLLLMPTELEAEQQ